MPQRLGALDSVFLNLEENRAPMHVGGLLTFVTESESTSRPGVDGIFDVIESRLPLLPRCRQRLVDVPFGLGRPVWIDDPDFDIRNHLIRVSLPRPGSREQLIALVESLHAQRLDRDRPLWEIYLIDGLEGGRTGIYAKLHHCMVDGISAVELGLVLLDLDPDGALAPKVPAAAAPGDIPLAGALLADAWRDAAVAMAAAGGQALRAAPSMLRRAVEDFSGDRNAAVSMLKMLRAAPGGPLNGSIGHGRRVAFVRLPLPAIKEVKNRLGGTVNDVVLATMGEAISHYLERRGIDADGLRYRVLVPVSVRGAGDKTMNNQVSGMLLDLPVGPMNPHRRLWAVSQAMAGMKEGGQSSATEQLMAATAFTPAPLHALASRLGMANQRIVNMVVSNVPGVQMPVYAAGSRALEMYPLLPLGPNTRLVVCVLSYNNELNIGLVADRASVPDLDVMEEGIRLGFDRLTAAAMTGQEASRPRPGRARAGGAGRPLTASTLSAAPPSKSERSPGARGPEPVLRSSALVPPGWPTSPPPRGQ